MHGRIHLLKWLNKSESESVSQNVYQILKPTEFFHSKDSLNFRKEVSAIRSIAYIRASINSFKMISKLSIFLSLIAYVYFGNVITAQKVFIVSSYLNILNLTMVYLWPFAVIQV